jgi:hypothetical protein
MKTSNDNCSSDNKINEPLLKNPKTKGRRLWKKIKKF